MPIHSLELTNVGPFRLRPDGSGADGIKLEFDPNVNLIIGPNNVGKSAIFQVMVAVMTRFASDVELPRSFIYSASDHSEEVNRPGAEFSLSWNGPIGDFRKLSSILTYYLDGDMEVTHLQILGPDGLQDIEGYDIDWEELVRDFGYMGYFNPALPPRKPAYVTVGTNLPKRAEGNEDDPNVYEAINLKRGGTRFERETAGEIEKVISEITQGFRVEMGVGDFTNDPKHGDYQWRQGQNKFDTMDGGLTFPELSHGTRSVFAWVAQLMLGMAQHYQNDGSWKQRRGVFIIDEIDAHLHPSWQRRIIPTLQRHFPNVQIFASTHSPMMVAGLKKGQVHLLKRDETGQVVWSRNEQDIIGWTADEIYRTFMGIDDPTDELTVQRANRLRQLRNKESRTEAEEDEMNALRRQVNEDLLAKGRINAQRERYAGLMEQFLRSRMTDLPQDGA